MSEQVPVERRQFCPAHEDNTKQLNRQAGQWKILIWALGITCSIMVMFCASTYNAQQVMVTSVTKMDKIHTAYIASSSQKLTEIYSRIDDCRESDHDHELRIRVLESKPYDFKP